MENTIVIVAVRLPSGTRDLSAIPICMEVYTTMLKWQKLETDETPSSNVIDESAWGCNSIPH
jgi:hypothetical protein